MKIGFTGTRNGLTAEQKASLEALLKSFQNDSLAFEIHHGDCVGADDEFVEACVRIYRCLVRVVCHPPLDESLRAFNKDHNEVLPAKSHFARNRDIVDACNVLIGCPGATTWQQRGGTFYTMDYAIKKKVPVKVIWPGGTVEDR